MKDYPQGLEPVAIRLGGTPRTDDQRRYIELDVFVDAVDSAIEYKQVGGLYKSKFHNIKSIGLNMIYYFSNYIS